MSGAAAPEVSVVTAVKNGERTLQRCLDSVFAQRDVRVESVVIDGGSSDGTLAILEANAARLGFFSSGPDSGIYAAWNKGIERARGEWICFLGCDDVLHDERALHDLVHSAAARERAARLVYGRLNLVSAAGVLAQTVGRPWQQARGDFLAGFSLPTPSMLHHRSLFDRHGRFDESYRIAGDYEFVLRELRSGEAAFVDRVVADMQIGGMSGRPDSIHQTLREVARARAAHGVDAASPRLRLALATSWIGAALYRLVGARAFGALADAYRLLRGRPRIWTV